jgi:hypothetical protein
VEDYGKTEDILVDGQVVELQHLEACERGLADAYDIYQRRAEHGPGLGHLADIHRRHARWLAGRLEALGGQPLPETDNEWLGGPADQLRSLVVAEHAAARTYHDHLGDFDVETLNLIRDRILPEQEELLSDLIGEHAPAGFSMEP